MKSLAFAAALIIIANAVFLNAQECVSSMPNTTSVPGECSSSFMAVDELLANITLPNFTDPNFNIRTYCMPTCVQQFLSYYTCFEEIESLNILDNIPDNISCGEFNNQSCLQRLNETVAMSNETLALRNETVPRMITLPAFNFTLPTRNCSGPGMGDDECSEELNEAIDTLGCCLAGIVESNSCGPLANSTRCEIEVPSTCDATRTVNTNCTYPDNDTDYPQECKDILREVETPFSCEAPAGVPSIVTARSILDRFCTPECIKPLFAYYNCTGEPEYAEAINGFFCGKMDSEYCIEVLPNTLDAPHAIAILIECNDTLECSTECLMNLTEVKEAAGCCLAGATELTGCGLLEEDRFGQCGVDVGGYCPGVDLMDRMRENSTSQNPSEESDVSGAAITMPFISLTLLCAVAFFPSQLT